MNSGIMPPLDESKKTPQTLIQRVWDWLTSPSPSLQDKGEQRSARLASSFLFIIAFLDFVGAVARFPRLGMIDSFRGGLGFSLLSAILAYVLARTRWYRLAIFIFSFSFSATAYTSIVAQGNSADFSALILVYVPISLIVAASFLSPWAVFLLTGLNIGALFATSLFGITLLPDNVGAQAGIITTIGFVLILLSNFRNNNEKIRLEEVKEINRELEALSRNLEQRVKERTIELEEASQQATRRAEQLGAVADLSRSFASLTALDELLKETAKLISQRLGYYHTGIFLLDENREYAVLEAANSTGGQKMLERRHRLRIGSEGIVGFATARGQARIALDVGADAVYFDNPDLPDTRSEVALPLKFGDLVIGALDIQSTEPNAFTNEDVAVFTVLADQLAIAIQNSRSLAQAQIAAAQAEEATHQLVGKAWSKIRSYIPVTGYRFDGVKPEPLTQPAQRSHAETHKGAYSVPVLLRGETIGKLQINPTTSEHQWTDDEIAIIRATAERVALAAENARLLQDAQRRAAKESTISEMSAQIGASVNLDDILKATVQELGRTIPGANVSVQVRSIDGR